jgi:hypothetical protein
MERENKFIAEVKDPITGEVIVFEGNSEEEITEQIDNFFENN